MFVTLAFAFGLKAKSTVPSVFNRAILLRAVPKADQLVAVMASSRKSAIK